MRKHEVKIEAESEEAAREKARALLETAEEEIEVLALGEGLFQASLVSVDAEIEVKVSPDKMEARIVGYLPPRGSGLPLDVVGLKAQLAAAGVKIELDEEAVASFLGGIEGHEGELDVVIARGTPARHGRDGRIEFIVKTGQSAGTVRENGSIDYHERSTVRTVIKDEIIGRLIPSEAGTPGCDVLGRTLTARDGHPVDLTVGENVEVSDDGLEYRAGISGMLTFAHNVLSVSQVFEVPGDIDFSTGNIHMNEGSTLVRGLVRSGFTVTSADNVVVCDSVEDARIEAGGDIEVQHGILMSDKGSIKAEGSVFARFAQNARIEAGGDVVIDNNLSNCDITCGGRVLATKGKGRIQGGIIRSKGGVEANEIGSEGSVKTQIVIYPTDSDQETLHAEPDEPGEEEAIRERSRAVIKVYKILHPGTIITIESCHLVVEHPIRAGMFFHDLNANSIKWTSL